MRRCDRMYLLGTGRWDPATSGWRCWTSAYRRALPPKPPTWSWYVSIFLNVHLCFSLLPICVPWGWQQIWLVLLAILWNGVCVFSYPIQWTATSTTSRWWTTSATGAPSSSTCSRWSPEAQPRARLMRFRWATRGPGSSGAFFAFLAQVSHKEPEILIFRLQQNFKVGLLQPSSVTAYEYYNPGTGHILRTL